MKHNNVESEFLLPDKKTYKYEDAPVYQKKPDYISVKLIKLGTRFAENKLTKEEKEKYIITDYSLCSYPKLYKYKMGENYFADVFYDFRIYIFNGFLTIEKNQHNFFGNKNFINNCFLNEKVLTYNSVYEKITLKSMLHDSEYNVIAENFNPEDSFDYNKIWIHYLKKN